MFAVCRSPFTVRARTTDRSRWLGNSCRFRPLRSANPLDQPRQHPFDVRSGAFQCFSLFWSKKSQVLRQKNKANHLVGRTCRYVQELPELGVGRPSASLRNISGDGRSRPTHLTGQAKSFGIRISSCRAIDAHSQSLTPLPDLQFSEILHKISPFSASLEGVTLAHKYITKQVLTLRMHLTANCEQQTANASGEVVC